MNLLTITFACIAGLPGNPPVGEQLPHPMVVIEGQGAAQGNNGSIGMQAWPATNPRMISPYSSIDYTRTEPMPQVMPNPPQPQKFNHYRAKPIFSRHYTYQQGEGPSTAAPSFKSRFELAKDRTAETIGGGGGFLTERELLPLRKQP
jgi:hypothetical protein